MNISLDADTPSASAADLTAGGNYSVWHTGTVIISAEIGGVAVVLHRSAEHTGIVLTGIPAATLTFTLAEGSPSAEIELNQLA